jgi:hypothetical protein
MEGIYMYLIRTVVCLMFGRNGRSPKQAVLRHVKYWKIEIALKES